MQSKSIPKYNLITSKSEVRSDKTKEAKQREWDKLQKKDRRVSEST